MCAVVNSPIHNEITSCSTVGWDNMPTEMFLYIFKKLDVTSLRCCFTVSRKWREIVACICEDQDLWQALTEDGMVNHGVTQELKSTLDWKYLYLNSLLWNKLPSATAHNLHQVKKPDIRNMHVYKDKLIVVNAIGVEYYDIESFQRIRFIPSTYCIDIQESDDILLVVTDMYSDERFRVTVFIKLHKNEIIDVDNYLITLIMPGNRSVHAFVESWHWRFVGNRVYVIDSRFVLWECSAKNNALVIKALAKYYGEIPKRMSTLSTIHVLGEDVYVALRWGRLVMVTKNSGMFQKVKVMEIPTNIVRCSNLNTTPCKEGYGTFNALIQFPFGVEFIDKSLAPINVIHYHYVDPEMTCGLQHGDVVLRGFVDGEITIDVLRSGFKYRLNVQQFEQHEIKEPAVTTLDVCEVKGAHKLLVATKHKLYMLLLKYPNDLQET